MVNTPCLSGAPVSFLDANGIQYAIPLAWIAFPPAPALADPSAWPRWSGGAAAQKSIITNWVGTLGTEGLLTPAIMVGANVASFTTYVLPAATAPTGVTTWQLLNTTVAV